MHTTNNVPQSRCRAFLIYGELSEMGRWSKRRWRHAEGLHFSLFSPHKQERPVSVCHNTHTSTLPHTAQRHEHMHKRVPPPPFKHTHTLPPTPSLPPRTHWSPPFPTQTPSLLQPRAKLTRIYPPLCTHALTQYTTRNYHTTIRLTQANPQGLSGPDWEPSENSVMNRLMCSTESAASRQTSFCWAICRYEYACESVTQATSTTYMMPKVTSVRKEILALCWAFGDM